MNISENQPNYKHGMAIKGNVNPTYNSWSQMMSRCYNKNSTRYKYYGRRGIKVCERWKNFTCFFEDMGQRPEGMTLDRIDNSKDYYKENCKWSTKKEQANNRRNNVLLAFDGRTMTIMQWADLFLVADKKRFHARICTDGWSLIKALTTPIRKKRISRRKLYSF